MKFNLIDISGIFIEHFKVIKESKNVFLFLFIPLIISLFGVYKNFSDSNLDSILSTCLSIFIGLFINLLVLVVSVLNSKIKYKRKERIELVKELFYNISFVLSISILSLVILLIKNFSLPEEYIYEGSILTYKTLYDVSLSFIFNFLFINIILTLLMITKRIYRLFDFDITQEAKKADRTKIKA